MPVRRFLVFPLSFNHLQHFLGLLAPSFATMFRHLPTPLRGTRRGSGDPCFCYAPVYSPLNGKSLSDKGLRQENSPPARFLCSFERMAMQLDESSQGPAPDGAASESKRNASWRAELNDNYCKLRKLELPPVGYGPDGKLKFAEKAVANPESYILWDVSRDAPPGFGLKVAGRKTYILRRKVMGKSMLATSPLPPRFNPCCPRQRRALRTASPPPSLAMASRRAPRHPFASLLSDDLGPRNNQAHGAGVGARGLFPFRFRLNRSVRATVEKSRLPSSVVRFHQVPSSASGPVCATVMAR